MNGTTIRLRLNRQRRGNAPLELVLFLPLLMVMLAAIVTVAEVAIFDSQVAVVARHQAFQGRRSPWQSGPGYEASDLGLREMEDIADILGPSSKTPADAGLLVSKVSRPVPAMFARYVGRLPTAKGTCSVLGGVWDHQEIEFASQSNHPRLTLSKKINYFGGARVGNLGLFGDLVQFSGSAMPHGIESLTGAVAGNGQAAGAAINGISKLFSDIAKETAKEHTNWSYIRKLERQIQSLKTAGDFLDYDPPK